MIPCDSQTDIFNSVLLWKKNPVKEREYVLVMSIRRQRKKL